MSRLKHFLFAAAAVAAVALAGPAVAEARGPIVVYRVGPRPIVRAPIAAVRTVRYVAPPYRPYVAPRVYVRPTVYVAPYDGPIIYVP
jgi:hypothetical protein